MKLSLGHTVICSFSFLLAMAVLISCTRFTEQSQQADEVTRVYPAKKEGAVVADAILYRKWNTSNNVRQGMGTLFTPMDGSRIQADLILKDSMLLKKELMIHFDWVGPDGKTFFLKRMLVSPADSIRSVNSSISLSPGIRDPGIHVLRVYLFRERILEKEFEVLPEFHLLNDGGEKLQTEIVLYRTKSKKSGKLIGMDTVFKRRKKRILRTRIDLLNPLVYGDRELLFRLDWFGQDGQRFFSKNFEVQPVDSNAYLRSSISLSPEKRSPGKHSLKLYLFDVLVEEQTFYLE